MVVEWVVEKFFELFDLKSLPSFSFRLHLHHHHHYHHYYHHHHFFWCNHKIDWQRPAPARPEMSCSRSDSPHPLVWWPPTRPWWTVARTSRPRTGRCASRSSAGSASPAHRRGSRRWFGGSSPCWGCRTRTSNSGRSDAPGGVGCRGSGWWRPRRRPQRPERLCLVLGVEIGFHLHRRLEVDWCRRLGRRRSRPGSQEKVRGSWRSLPKKKD